MKRIDVINAYIFTLDINAVGSVTAKKNEINK
jgi:hypothetical protein